MRGNHTDNRYDRSWKSHLDAGHEDYGDSGQALEFLESTDMLRPYHSILEIGGGIGKLSNALMGKGLTNLTCTDISEVSVNYGKSKYPNLNIVVMDACKLEFEMATFDRCISFDLLEHITAVDMHISEAYRVLKPGGYYLFQTPNILTNSVWETINARGFSWREYHPSLQSARSLKSKLRHAGFTDVEFTRLPPTSDYKVNQLPKHLRLIFKSIPWQSLPLFMQVGFWVIARK